MTTNLKRTVIEEKTVDFLSVVRFSTGAFEASHGSSRTLVFSLTNTQKVADLGYLDKLVELLVNQETFKLQSRFGGGVRLELKPSLEHGFMFILDSELSAAAKLAYLISLLSIGVKLGDETLATIFRVRPEPVDELEQLTIPLGTSEEGLIRRSLLPDFSPTGDVKLETEDDFRRYCLTISFIGSPKAIRYADFMESHRDNFFVPVITRNTWGSGKLLAPINPKVVADLFPREYYRFMRYFNSGIVRELRGWARARFDSKIETVKELQDRGVLNNAVLMNWRKVMGYLTLEEAKAFSVYVAEANGIGSIYRGASDDVASLIAFYWAEGGADKLNELAQHIASSQINSAPGDFGPIQSMTLDWKNPYANTKGRPDLMPYVKAVSDPDLRTMPLEWALASY